MNKKKLFAGIIATIVAMGSTALACHISFKKNTENKNSNDNKKTQYPKETKPQPTENVEIMKTMYGIPADIDKPWDPSMGNEVIIIEKYALPPIDENIPILKYASPKIIENVKKYAVPTIDRSKYNNIVKYASPEYFQEQKIKPMPSATEIPVAKYAAPYIKEQPINTDADGNQIYLPMYALPDPEIDKNIKTDDNSSIKDKNPWK